MFDPVFWNPQTKFEFTFKSPNIPLKQLETFTPLIYEVHIGLSSEEGKISSYLEFTHNVLPRIKKNGYNTIQIMAIMEHAYYGSFGYHVTNFFAISSKFGTPDDLKYLINEAHSLGLYVLIDLVHSHASTNVMDGINNLDGTDYLYFHSGERGKHLLWDSRCFDYSHYETKRFLLSNLAYYLIEYNFDGFRFDGITSMLYIHHGIGHAFVNGYDEYFNKDLTDDFACAYLMLANYLIKKINPYAITIAEDVSGMPGLCRPIKEGGFGFDYRLNMSVPDMWIKLLKEQSDDEWNMRNIVFNLTNRRWNEKHIAYAESHDQSIVGDKTISMWLFDKEIYHNMSILTEPTVIIDRGIALHKMIRLITFSLGGEGYLNFIGNEFGHPEWVDFPRDGNNYSYHFCRRQWSLSENEILRYKHLLHFDNAMIDLEHQYNFIQGNHEERFHEYISLTHEADKLITFEKSNLLFIFNFHPHKSYENYLIRTEYPKDHIVVLSTDDIEFGGHNRVSKSQIYRPTKEETPGRKYSIKLYIPSRCAIVLKSGW